MTKNQLHVVSTGIQNILCGALAAIITASLSSGFVMSSSTLQWMGSGALDPVAVITAS
jgi:hypothetical protein